MVSWTWPTLPSLRLRFALFEDARWRNPGLRRSSLPVAVNLNRLATAFFVLRRAMDFGMGVGTLAGKTQRAISFYGNSSVGRVRLLEEANLPHLVKEEARLSPGQRGGGGVAPRDRGE